MAPHGAGPRRAPSRTRRWASFVLLARALDGLPVGTGYAVWTGIGAVGAALVGVLVLNEPAGAARLLAIATIAVGIVWLAVAGETG